MCFWWTTEQRLIVQPRYHPMKLCSIAKCLINCRQLFKYPILNKFQNKIINRRIKWNFTRINRETNTEPSVQVIKFLSRMTNKEKLIQFTNQKSTKLSNKKDLALSSKGVKVSWWEIRLILNQFLHHYKKYQSKLAIRMKMTKMTTTTTRILLHHWILNKNARIEYRSHPRHRSLPEYCCKKTIETKIRDLAFHQKMSLKLNERNSAVLPNRLKDGGIE